VTILCYHAVDPAWRSPLAVTPDAFEAHCTWLARRRTVLPLDDASAALDRSFRLPRGTTAVTFDDGFRNVLEHALPILRRHRLPATVFVVAETLTPAGRAVDWVDTPPADGARLETLTLDELQELQDGGVSIGSHSYSHRVLTELGEDECERDLRASRELLEDLLGRPVPHLAYPRGYHDEHVRRAAARAGFANSFTLPESPEPVGPQAVPRVGVYPGNSERSLRWKTTRPYLRLRTGPAYPTVRRVLKGSAPPTRRAG
jgi:peptidoglycan/xylan/chitin deacetylase (PgdA/CDA1 family)